MNNLFTRVCRELARTPKQSSTNTVTLKVNTAAFSGISAEDALKPENHDKLFSTLKAFGYRGKYLPRFPKIAINARKQYEASGYKKLRAFMKLHNSVGGRFYSVVIELGVKPLYSSATVDTAKRAVKRLVGNCPVFWKIERHNSTESRLHVHLLMLIPDEFRFPSRVNNFRVLAQPLGMNYPNKSTYCNLRDFIIYLYKPADARASFKIDSRVREMYLEWWREMINAATGNHTWENVQLKGTFNLDCKTKLKFEDVESMYFPISALETRAIDKNPVLHDENHSSSQIDTVESIPSPKPNFWMNLLTSKILNSYLKIPGFRDEIPGQSSLGNGAGRGVLKLLYNLDTTRAFSLIDGMSYRMPRYSRLL